MEEEIQMNFVDNSSIAGTQGDSQDSALTINDNFFAPHFNLFDSDARFFDISVISV
jgi:hypothetical protein